MRERAAALTGCRAFALRGCWVLGAYSAAGVAGAVGSGRCVCWWAVAFLRVLLVVPLVLRAPSGPAAREIAARELRSERSISKPARALRTLRRPPQQWRMVADRWLGASSQSPARPCRCPSVPFTSAASLRPCLRARIGCYFTDRL